MAERACFYLGHLFFPGRGDASAALVPPSELVIELPDGIAAKDVEIYALVGGGQERMGSQLVIRLNVPKKEAPRG